MKSRLSTLKKIADSEKPLQEHKVNSSSYSKAVLEVQSMLVCITIYSAEPTIRSLDSIGWTICQYPCIRCTRIHASDNSPISSFPIWSCFCFVSSCRDSQKPNMKVDKEMILENNKLLAYALSKSLIMWKI